VPFTPFHLGPALGIGLPLRRRIHVPTFLVASVIVDAEPIAVILLGIDYPLHGYLHTFLGAVVVGLALGYAMYSLEGALGPAWRRLLLVHDEGLGPGAFAAAGVLGTALHVLLDSPLYSDIRPLLPLTTNPLYNPRLVGPVYGVCVATGAAGLAYYLYLLLGPLPDDGPRSPVASA